MLEALIALGGDGTTTQAGDVLVLKLSGAPWGLEERTRFRLVEWDDDEIEAQLLARRASGDPYPVMDFPYAEYAEKPFNDQGFVLKKLVKRATVRVDVNQMPFAPAPDKGAEPIDPAWVVEDPDAPLGLLDRLRAWWNG